MQCYLNGMDPGAKKYGQLQSPSIVFVFLDEAPNSIDDGMFWLRRDPDNKWANVVSDRHGQGANISFADGHGEYVHWKAPKKDHNYDHVATGSDLDDLRKLQNWLVPAS